MIWTWFILRKQYSTNFTMLDNKMNPSLPTLDLNPQLQLRETRHFPNALASLLDYIIWFLTLSSWLPCFPFPWLIDPLVTCLSLYVLSCIWWYEGAWHACNACDAWSPFGAHALHVMHDSHHAHLSSNVWRCTCHNYDDKNLAIENNLS